MDFTEPVCLGGRGFLHTSTDLVFTSAAGNSVPWERREGWRVKWEGEMFGSLGMLKKGLHFENVTLDLHSFVLSKVLWLDFTGYSDSN